MSYIRLETHAGGTDVWFRDYQDNGALGQYGNALTASAGCGPEDGFRNIKVATVSNDQPHTVKLAIDFLDGPHNDIVKVYVDGVLSQTGTTRSPAISATATTSNTTTTSKAITSSQRQSIWPST